MEWTADQKKVIETRGKNILVSAGAGSGKTAVLVQRILSRIMDPEDPVNIDELLIVTFTRAAAAEMKERIEAALYKAQEEQPINEHLMRQSALIHNAQITTIDGFCAYVVRNYGQTIGLVPGMRLMDAGEASLFQADALHEVLEAEYALTGEEGERFHTCIETFVTGKSEQRFEETILRLAEEAESYPDPFAFLAKCRDSCTVADPHGLEKLSWMKQYTADAQETARIMLRHANDNLALAERLTVPGNYVTITSKDVDFCRSLGKCASYTEFHDCLLSFEEGQRLKPGKGAPKEEDPQRKLIQNNRSKYIKDERNKLLTSFQLPLDQAAKALNISAGPLITLIDVTEKLLKTYAEKKADKNVCDFSDQEHFCLRILKKGGRRTPAAKELASRFREVMIDEYQDSNYLQEEILTAVSRGEDGEQNYFCVGDVKQSIYRFRQARPELFMKKYALYRAEPDKGTRIDLHRNFRSRRQVIDAVNGIFSQIMVPDVGGVLYDDDAALVAGAAYPTASGFQTEILPVMEKEKLQDGTSLEDEEKIAKPQLEARAIGKRIREMVGHESIFDQHSGKMRTVDYRDIVILMRSPKSWSSTAEEVLTGMGIPIYVTLRDGYFSASEVIAVLNFLSIVDNPQQDLPFTGVLRSAFVSLTADDLARIRLVHGAVSYGGSVKRDDISMYDAAKAYADHGEDFALKHKLEDFFAFYDELRASVPDTMLHELIYRILTETGYLDYVSALPDGAQRVLNLRMLIDRAVTYETGSYIGLFNFIRYIENLQKQDVDLGEMSTISENDNVVRIISIHKSKGLEFPVVFVAGLGRQFNNQDLYHQVLIHSEMGVASDAVDLKKRVRTPTLRKTAITQRLLRDTRGEELRVLYVAMTRAKQKLILTGTVRDDKALDDMLFKDLPLDEEHLPSGAITRAASYFSWIIPAADRVLQSDKKKGISEEDSCLTIRPVHLSDLITEDLETSIRREDVITTLAALKEDTVYDRAMHKTIEETFSYRYPYESEISLPVEISVSDLKKGKYSDDEEEFSAASNTEPLYSAEPIVPLVPDFVLRRQAAKEAAETSSMGARRGTAVHRVMQLMNFEALKGLSGKELVTAIKTQITDEIRRGRIDAEDAHLVSTWKVAEFFKSELGQRAISAAARGSLFREKQFVLGVPASEINPKWPSGETVFVQGIIDAFFFEDDSAVLLDYKTDYVEEPQTLVDRYRIQMKEYAEALRRTTQRPVTEIYLWSFRLNQAISVSTLL